MTDTLIPYSFIPGTKAKAQEVNANFIALSNSISENTATLNSSKMNKDLSNITQTGIDIIKNNSASPRNIGEIISSTIPLTDSYLHLLDGALLDGSGSYSDFVDYIATLYASNPTASYFTTEANWQSAVTTYGVCGKFVYDSVNNTVRLPKYSNKIWSQNIKQSTAPVIGTGKMLGFVNSTTNTTTAAGLMNTATQYWASGFSNNQSSATNVGTSISADNNRYSSGVWGVSKNPNLSGLIAQLSNLTTPLEGYYYIVVATSTKTDIQIDIDEIATDLNGKTDTDLTNVNNSGTSLGASWAMPSGTTIQLTAGASGSTYTAPANGYYFLKVAKLQGANSMIRLESSTCCSYCTSPSSGTATAAVSIPVRKGQVVTIGLFGTYESVAGFVFTYAKGSESEAQ